MKGMLRGGGGGGGGDDASVADGVLPLGACPPTRDYLRPVHTSALLLWRRASRRRSTAWSRSVCLASRAMNYGPSKMQSASTQVLRGSTCAHMRIPIRLDVCACVCILITPANTRPREAGRCKYDGCDARRPLSSGAETAASSLLIGIVFAKKTQL